MWVLFIGWVYSIFLIESTLCDLPSCIRAKCSHCKVPFIAQMCLNACSGCPTVTQNHLTYEKEARTSSGEIAHQRAFHSRIKVPFAQQIPYVDSNNRGPFNPIERNNNIQKPSQQNQQFIIQKQPQTNIFPQVQSGTWQQNGIAPADQKFTQPIPNNQFGTQQSQQFTQYPINFPQQTTNYGGSYGPGEGAFNPFQPFLQQSFQSMQQIQPPVSSQSQPTYSPILQPNTQILQQPKPPQPYIGSQAEQNGQFKLGGQIQQNGQFPNTQQFIQQPFDGQQLQTNQNQPILHAVPNVVDPLQRPRQLHNLPSQLELREKWNEGKTIYPKVIPANEIKKPEIIRNNFASGSNGQTCPKTNWEPCVPKDIANKRFQNCCSGLGEGCSQLCSYDQNLTTIQLAVLTGRCPVNKVADMMICASGYEDATACCQAFGVFEAGYEHCRPYCNPAGGLPNDGMLAEKYRCLQKLQQIQRCFYLTQRP